ncbi:signal transducer CD24 [Hemicordylus capensis]|uniref:signal transducer CD24 n=1 Tax=Hemicordylus capensis TaxID=884348 RepID=UPI0023034A5C|nr:signal transducer CD24 [Hemicordylus capensis]
MPVWAEPKKEKPGEALWGGDREGGQPAPLRLVSWRAHKSPAQPPPPRCISRAASGDSKALTARGEMGTALATRLGLGLLLLALLLPTQTGGDNGTTTTLSNNLSSTSVPLSTLSNTTHGHGNSLQSTTGLFILSISLLYFC